jgi:hypothetical protein
MYQKYLRFVLDDFNFVKKAQNASEEILGYFYGLLLKICFEAVMKIRLFNTDFN